MMVVVATTCWISIVVLLRRRIRHDRITRVLVSKTISEITMMCDNDVVWP
jgi:hypothetical protein